SAVFTLTNGITVKRATSTAVTSNLNPSTYGQSVTFTATVSGTGAGSGNPGAGDGTVTFKADGTAVTGCSGVVLVAGGQAACSTAALRAIGSPHSITAEYTGGSSNFFDSNSN